MEKYTINFACGELTLTPRKIDYLSALSDDKLLYEMENLFAEYTQRMARHRKREAYEWHRVSRKTIDGFVYFAKGSKDGFTKIGCSINPNSRMKNLKNEYSQSFDLLFTIPSSHMYELERRYHAWFCDYRHKGEFYDLDAHSLKWAMGFGASYLSQVNPWD